MKGILAVTALLFLLPAGANSDPVADCREHLKFGVPGSSGDLLCKTGFALLHNPVRKTADWVAYRISADRLPGEHSRSDDFRPDPELAPGSRAELADYKRSGFDRGHMAPAAAMKWSREAMTDSFLLSNMAPQVGNKMNRGIWRILEEKVREWAAARGELYVFTGNIYDTPDPQTIGANRVAVPSHCYKVIFDPVQIEAIAFIVPNARSEIDQLPGFIVSVDEVESRTGLDFLSAMDDNIEAIVESSITGDMW